MNSIKIPVHKLVKLYGDNLYFISVLFYTPTYSENIIKRTFTRNMPTNFNQVLNFNFDKFNTFINKFLNLKEQYFKIYVSFSEFENGNNITYGYEFSYDDAVYIHSQFLTNQKPIITSNKQCHTNKFIRCNQ